MHVCYPGNTRAELILTFFWTIGILACLITLFKRDTWKRTVILGICLLLCWMEHHVLHSLLFLKERNSAALCQLFKTKIEMLICLHLALGHSYWPTFFRSCYWLIYKVLCRDGAHGERLKFIIEVEHRYIFKVSELLLQRSHFAKVISGSFPYFSCLETNWVSRYTALYGSAAFTLITAAAGALKRKLRCSG